MVDISVNTVRGPQSSTESVEGDAHTLQDLTLGNDDGFGDKQLTES